ncbi:MAG: glycogen synthase GlgA [Nitrospirota bacterium]
MRVLIAASEAVPFAKTGGLADVTGTLLKVFNGTAGVDAALMLPLYKGIKERFKLAETGIRLVIPVGNARHEGRVWKHDSAYFIECAEFFDRPELYGTKDSDYPDNPERFAFFCKAALEACMALDLKPDVVHCNDWQTALMPAYIKSVYSNDFFRKTASVLTIHNLGYQGIFDPTSFSLTGLGSEWFSAEGAEFYGKVNFLKAGLVSADIITTVSHTYSGEILTPEYGFGLDGVLRKRSSDIFSVLNGIDIKEWDPETDKYIPANYSRSGLNGKALCREALFKDCGLSVGESDNPVISFVGRLSEQKGIDIILETLDDILSAGALLVVLGKGDERYQSGLARVAERHKGRVFVRIGYDDALSHRIYAGSDIFLMPSRYEPCGLGQLIAMRYGTIPVARKTGGLADTISDYQSSDGSGTGFLFEDYNASSLMSRLRHAISVYADKERWKGLVMNALGCDFSWERSAARYAELYKAAFDKKEIN